MCLKVTDAYSDDEHDCTLSSAGSDLAAPLQVINQKCIFFWHTSPPPSFLEGKWFQDWGGQVSSFIMKLFPKFIHFFLKTTYFSQFSEELKRT